ncbi:MAG: hypothetical protein SFZ23_06600 [Planctomycetota bacterium]|nr:hypothetical protein [Planctomycetota bacterium]
MPRQPGELETVFNTDDPIDNARPPEPTPQIPLWRQDPHFTLVGTPNGIPDSFDYLIHRIKILGANGFRRFVLMLPGGVQGVKYAGESPADPNNNGQTYPVYNGTNQSMNQYLAMPEWKRQYFTGFTVIGDVAYRNAWGQFIDEYAATRPDDEPDKYSIEVYVGGRIYPPDVCGLFTEHTEPNPDNPYSTIPYRILSFKKYNTNGTADFSWVWGTPNPVTLPNPLAKLHPVNPYVESHMAYLWRHVWPWVNAGVKSIWLDAVSDNSPGGESRWGALEISHNPYLRQLNIRIGGENLPTLDSGADLPDDCALATMRWLTLAHSTWVDGCQRPRQYKRYRNPATGYLEDHFWFDRAATEIHLVDACDGSMTHGEILEARNRGFVTSIFMHRDKMEQVKRWYSMGPIQVADFDGNGVPSTTADYQLAYDVILDHMFNPYLYADQVVATGDINRDGEVTAADLVEFEDFFWNRPFEIRDYGAPDDM